MIGRLLDHPELGFLFARDCGCGTRIKGAFLFRLALSAVLLLDGARDGEIDALGLHERSRTQICAYTRDIADSIFS